MTVEEINDILTQVRFEAYRFFVRDRGDGWYLQGVYDEPDVYTGKVMPQYTRKWLLSPYMTRSEIVQTAFKLCATSMEHRCREGFTYRGRRVFGPHFDVDDLWSLCRDRENAGGRK